MKAKFFLVTTLVLAIVLTACGAQGSPALNTAVSAATQAAPTVQNALTQAAPTVQSAVTELAPTIESALTQVAPTLQSAIQNLDSLVAAFRAVGMTVELGGPIDQPFFKVQGQSLKVNGGDVQVYVYDSAQAMEADASQISADGNSIGTSMADWTGTPHFFKTGNVLLLYLGDDQTLLGLLQNLFGSQFAGG
jgi:ABC-type transporter Mla subunit MlaD